MDRHPLVGTWRLRSWDSGGDDGSVDRPMGDTPEGILVYTAEGTMVTLIGRAGRPWFAADDLAGGTPEEMAGAVASFIAYGGTYTVDGSVVTHHVQMSLFPNWVGSRQARTMTFEAGSDTLTLTSAPIPVGGARRSQRLCWERVRP